MPVTVLGISEAERDKILAIEETHFADVKSRLISPGKLTKTIAAFSNAEGGELYVGISQDHSTPRRNLWDGFPDAESANGHIQAFEGLFPPGDGYAYSFLRSATSQGLVLKIDIAKSREVKKASDDRAYIRRGAQSLPVDSEEDLARLRRNKGLTSFESEPVSAATQVITNSAVTLEFMLQVVPTGEPAPWLRKQQLIQGDKPTVAGLILFAEEPQAFLPKRSGI